MRCVAGLAVFATLGAGTAAVLRTSSDAAQGKPAPERERVRAAVAYLSLGRAGGALVPRPRQAREAAQLQGRAQP